MLIIISTSSLKNFVVQTFLTFSHSMWFYFIFHHHFPKGLCRSHKFFISWLEIAFLPNFLIFLPCHPPPCLHLLLSIFTSGSWTIWKNHEQSASTPLYLFASLFTSIEQYLFLTISPSLSSTHFDSISLSLFLLQE